MIDDGHGSCIGSIVKRCIYNGRKLVAYRYHRSDCKRQDCALSLSREIKD